MADHIRMVTPKGNSVLVVEADVEKFRVERDWAVEGDEPEEHVDPTSVDVTAKEAIADLMDLVSVEAVEAYTEGEDRKSVVEAADKRIEEISVPPSEDENEE